MTPEDHNKVIGIMHLIYGGLFTLVTIMMFFVFVVMGGMLSGLPQEPGTPPPVFFIGIFGFILIVYALLSIPPLIAGYGMLKKRSWARVAAIIASALSALSFPFGTALAVYSFWFLFGDAGKAFEQGGSHSKMYGSLNSAPPPPNFDWNTPRTSQDREREYVPPSQPPDWRNNS